MINLLKKIKHKLFKNYYRNKLINIWIENNKPFPIPHVLKQMIIESYKKKSNAKILVETGTHKGDMVSAQLNNFKTIYSIELSEELYSFCKEKFKNNKHVKLYQGDSGVELNKIVPLLNESTVFFLDGHYSGGITALGDKECPIFEELNAIFSSKKLNLFTILIDDARLFIGKNDYPTIDQLKEYLHSKNVTYFFEVIDDTIRISNIKLK